MEWISVYERLLRQLNDLVEAGEGDGATAEAIRAQMDAPWHAMTRQEQDQMRDLIVKLAMPLFADRVMALGYRPEADGPAI